MPAAQARSLESIGIWTCHIVIRPESVFRRGRCDALLIVIAVHGDLHDLAGRLFVQTHTLDPVDRSATAPARASMAAAFGNEGSGRHFDILDRARRLCGGTIVLALIEPALIVGAHRPTSEEWGEALHE